MVGPNGCGKTTLIEILLGLRRPDAGEVQLFGLSPWVNQAKIAPRLGATLQGASMHPQVTPLEALQFSAALYHKSNEKMHTLIKTLDLEEVQKRRYGKLSGGQQCRVLVASALLAEPELLVLDEPSSGVDMESRDVLWSVIRSYCAHKKPACLQQRTILMRRKTKPIECL